jgi:tetratricopeptide (TPR) repeat protein
MSIYLLFMGMGYVRAESPQELYKAANAQYADGKFSDAAQKYQAAADQGLRHWVLEYDLANACYRAGQLGKAILHYERAFRMNSGQSDVLYNLDLATKKAGDPELPGTALPLLAWRLFYFLPINTLTLLTSLFILVLTAAAGSALMGKYFLKADAVFALVLVFMVLGGWLGARIYLLETAQGVVVSPVAEVRSGPNTTYAANFTIPEGRRVLILKEQEPIQGWLEIGVPQEGLKGWVPDTSVEII